MAKQARDCNEKAHVGRIFEICVKKNSELKSDLPAGQFKGRVVFQGNQVGDENWGVAFCFQELGSSRATMEAGRACAFRVIKGHDAHQVDAEQAYIQSTLGGDVTTWARLHPERRPKAWARTRDPVRPLMLALYGRRDAGGYWEKHFHAHLTSVGFVRVPHWRPRYIHPKIRFVLVVRVDDVKLAGPAGALPNGWPLIRQKVRMENLTPLGNVPRV